MIEPRIANALSRLDKALDRLEERRARHHDLSRRHAALQDGARDTLVMLDTLIAVERG